MSDDRTDGDLIDETLLRAGFAMLLLDEPVSADRVGAVRGLVRRRTRRRAVVGGGVLAAAAVAGALLVLPGQDAPASLAPATPPSAGPVVDRTDYRLTLTDLVVSTTVASFAEQADLVGARLLAVPGLPPYVGRPAPEGSVELFTEEPGPRVRELRVFFAERLTVAQREAVSQALIGLPGLLASSGDEEGFDLELVAQLSPQVLRTMQEPSSGVPEDLAPVGEALGRGLTYRRSEQGELVVRYVGPPLSPETVSQAQRAMQRVTGAGPGEVLARRGPGDDGASYVVTSP